MKITDEQISPRLLVDEMFDNQHLGILVDEMTENQHTSPWILRWLIHKPPRPLDDKMTDRQSTPRPWMMKWLTDNQHQGL